MGKLKIENNPKVEGLSKKNITIIAGNIIAISDTLGGCVLEGLTDRRPIYKNTFIFMEEAKKIREEQKVIEDSYNKEGYNELYGKISAYNGWLRSDKREEDPEPTKPSLKEIEKFNKLHPEYISEIEALYKEERGLEIYPISEKLFDKLLEKNKSITGRAASIIDHYLVD